MKKQPMTRLQRQRINTSRAQRRRRPGQRLAPRFPYMHGGHNQRSARQAEGAYFAQFDAFDYDYRSGRPLPRRITKKALSKRNAGQALSGRRERRIVAEYLRDQEQAWEAEMERTCR